MSDSGSSIRSSRSMTIDSRAGIDVPVEFSRR